MTQSQNKLFTKKVIDAWIEELLSNRNFIEKVELVEAEGKSQYQFTLKKSEVSLNSSKGYKEK